MGYHCIVQVAVIQAEVLVKQKECEDDLAKAEPLLTAATAALHTLNKVPHFIHKHNKTNNHILVTASQIVFVFCFFSQVNLTELKAFPNPPAAVTNVAAAVMVLLAPRGRVPKDRSWKAARAFMGKVKLSPCQSNLPD